MIDPLTATGTCLVFANNTANGASCGQILGGIIGRATTPLEYWAYGATAAVICMGIVTPIYIWRNGSLGRRVWNYGGDFVLMLFPNRTAELYKVSHAFSSWLRLTSKRVTGLIRSGEGTGFSLMGHALHVVEAVTRTAANLDVVDYTEALDDVKKGTREFAAGQVPSSIPRNMDEAARLYFKDRIQGKQPEIDKLKTNYQLTYGEEIPEEIVTALGGKEDPFPAMLKAGGEYLRRFRELMIEAALGDPKPLWTIKGLREGVDARCVFRWVASQDHPVDFDVAYQSGYDDGKADQKTDDKKMFWIALIVAIFVGGAIFWGVAKG